MSLPGCVARWCAILAGMSTMSPGPNPLDHPALNGSPSDFTDASRLRIGQRGTDRQNPFTSHDEIDVVSSLVNLKWTVFVVRKISAPNCPPRRGKVPAFGVLIDLAVLLQLVGGPHRESWRISALRLECQRRECNRYVTRPTQQRIVSFRFSLHSIDWTTHNQHSLSLTGCGTARPSALVTLVPLVGLFAQCSMRAAFAGRGSRPPVARGNETSTSAGAVSRWLNGAHVAISALDTPNHAAYFL